MAGTTHKLIVVRTTEGVQVTATTMEARLAEIGRRFDGVQANPHVGNGEAELQSEVNTMPLGVPPVREGGSLKR